MSAAISLRLCGSLTAISPANRRRVSGVRISCEMPASMVLRSRSSRSRLAAMRLTLRETRAISVGPSSGSGSGRLPTATLSTASAKSASGRDKRRANHSVAASKIASKTPSVNKSRIGTSPASTLRIGIPAHTARAPCSPSLSLIHTTG